MSRRVDFDSKRQVVRLARDSRLQLDRERWVFIQASVIEPFLKTPEDSHALDENLRVFGNTFFSRNGEGGNIGRVWRRSHPKKNGRRTPVVDSPDQSTGSDRCWIDIGRSIYFLEWEFLVGLSTVFSLHLSFESISLRSIKLAVGRNGSDSFCPRGASAGMRCRGPVSIQS